MRKRLYVSRFRGIPQVQTLSNGTIGLDRGHTNTMEQVAALAKFLCGDDAASITGAILPIDGGWTAQ